MLCMHVMCTFECWFIAQALLILSSAVVYNLATVCNMGNAKYTRVDFGKSALTIAEVKRLMV